MPIRLNHVQYDTQKHSYITQLSHVVCSYLFTNSRAKCIKMTDSKAMWLYMNWTYMTYIVIFALRHACVQATLYDICLSGYIRVGIRLIRHICPNVSHENLKGH